MSERALKNISIVVVLLLGIAFVVKFGTPAILRAYIELGIGNCQKIPILCMVPTEEIVDHQINKEYLEGLLPYEFPKMKIYMQKSFNVVQEMIKKIYYKKNKRLYKGAIVYVLHQEPNFFVNLFPRLKKQGVTDNYEFLRQTMYANINNIKNINDAFFVIMKGIFIPDLGDQRDVKMARFTIADKRGFINYNLGKIDNYFDCNIIDNEGSFFKAYIKDKGAKLDLDKVLTIIAKVKRAE